MRPTTTTLERLFKRCLQASRIPCQARTFSASASLSEAEETKPQPAGIPLAFDLGGISISASAPFASRLAQRRLEFKSSRTAARTAARTKSPWRSDRPRSESPSRLRKSDTNNRHPHGNNSQRSSQRSTTQSNIFASKQPGTTTTTDAKKPHVPKLTSSNSGRIGSRSGERSSRNDRHGGGVTKNEGRLATAKTVEPQQQAARNDAAGARNRPRPSASTRKPSSEAQTSSRKNDSASQKADGQTQQTAGRPMTRRRRRARASAPTTEDATTETSAETDSKIFAITPSFPALDRAFSLSVSPRSELPSSTALASPAGADEALQSSSTATLGGAKSSLVRYPDILASARLALSRHGNIHTGDRRQALRVVKRLAGRGRLFTKSIS